MGCKRDITADSLKIEKEISQEFDGLVTETVNKITKINNQRIERAIIEAIREGYDYVDVGLVPENHRMRNVINPPIHKTNEDSPS